MFDYDKVHNIHLINTIFAVQLFKKNIAVEWNECKVAYRGDQDNLDISRAHTRR